MSLASSTIGLSVIVPLLFIPVAFAAAPAVGQPGIPASGTWTDQQLVSLVESIGPNGVPIEQATITGVIAGSVSGTYSTTSTVYMISPTQAYYYAVDHCTCTIDGNGPYPMAFNEFGSLTPSQDGYYILASNAVASATGSPNYYVSLQLQGTLNPLTDLSSGSYSGTYTYHP